MTVVADDKANLSTRKLTRVLRGDPEALLQLLLSALGKSVKRRIYGAPAFPAPKSTPDLSFRLRLFRESTGSRTILIPETLSQLYNSAVDRRHRKSYGQFVTPTRIALQVINRLNIKTGSTILDAGAGTGIFPAALLRQIRQRSASVVYLGIEIDPLLCLCAAMSLERSDAPRSWKILCRNFLRVDNNLLARLGINHVDVIISNPPFVRHHMISDRIPVSSRIEQRTGLELSGYSGTHSFFLAHATTILDAKGKLGFLLPLSMREVDYGASLLSQLEQRFVISEPKVPGDIRLFILRPRKRRGFSEKRPVARGAKLKHFGRVHRGISTGANSFFVLTEEDVIRYDIPRTNLVKVLPTKTRLISTTYTDTQWESQKAAGDPCWLLHIQAEGNERLLPTSIRNYLKIGEQKGIPQTWTSTNRIPWYTVRLTDPPDLIFTYISRNPRFVYNEAGIRILTNVLGVYFNERFRLDASEMSRIAGFLGVDITRWMSESQAGRRYEGGLIKFEPGDLEDLPLSIESLGVLPNANTSLLGFMNKTENELDS